MLIKISTSQVKKKETSALYRKQIEIYCERLRKKEINLAQWWSRGRGGGGTPELRWRDDLEMPKINPPPPRQNKKEVTIWDVFVTVFVFFQCLKHGKKRYLSVWLWVKKQETNYFVLFISVLRSTGFKWAKVTLFQANSANIWMYENIKACSNPGGYSLWWPIRGGSARKGYLSQASGAV